MSAVFGTPVAATLFGVELLAFEFRPRSMVLIGLAAATADGLRMVMASAGLVAPQPIFPVPATRRSAAWSCSARRPSGVAAGLAAWLMTQAVYRSEDLFKKLTGHLHWMWWPMIGGLIIGARRPGRSPRARRRLRHHPRRAARPARRRRPAPAVRGQAGHLVRRPRQRNERRHPGPDPDDGRRPRRHPGPRPARARRPGSGRSSAWPARSAGVTRSPFTAIIFAFELTHDQNSLLALLVVATVAHLVSVLVLKRSILTEKVARRGFHVMREYAVDPLEATFVREVMDTDVYTVEPDRERSPISTGRWPKDRPSDASGSTRCSTATADWSGSCRGRRCWPPRTTRSRRCARP